MLEAAQSLDVMTTKLKSLFNRMEKDGDACAKSRFDQLINLLVSRTRYHSELHEPATAFTSALAGYLWASRQDMVNLGAVEQCISQCHSHLLAWKPNKGRVGKEFPSLLADLNSLLAGGVAHNDERWNTLLGGIQEYGANHQQRSEAFEQRQLSGTLNLHNLDKARAALQNEINAVLEFSYLPHWLIEFINKTLVADLTTLYLSDHNSITIELWISLLDDIKWVFKQELKGEELTGHQQLIYQKVPTIIDTVNEKLSFGLPNSIHYANILEQLAESLFALVKQEQVDVIAYPCIPVPQVHATIKMNSKGNLQNQHKLVTGNWFHLLEADAKNSCHKLFHQDTSSGVSYFSDYYGKNTLHLESQELMLLLATKKLKPAPIFKNEFSALLSRFIKHEQGKAYSIEDSVKLQQQVVPPRYKASSPNDVKRSVDKISQELNTFSQNEREIDPILAKSDDNIESNADALANEVAAIDEPTAAFINQINTLQLGAWVKFLGNETEMQKLTLKLPSSDKYVFTDRLGRKTGEYKLTELISFHKQARVEIISRGEQFDSKLEQIVRGQRQ